MQDRASKRPFDPSLQLSKNIKQTSLANVLPCCPAGGTVDANSGDHILLIPPFFLEDVHIEQLVVKLNMSLRTVLET